MTRREIPTATDAARLVEPLTVRTLADLLERPELLAPPEPVVAPFLYAGRVTLLSGREKSGKTTLAAGAAAALTAGADFLGSRLRPSRVLWIGLDEALGDTVRRFLALGADATRLDIVTDVPLPSRLQVTLAANDYALVVLDTINEVMAGGSLNEAADVGKVLRPIVNVIRESGAAGLIIGHAGKSSGAYLGSVTIGGLVDAPLTLKRVGEAKLAPLDPNLDDDSEDAHDDGRRVLVGHTRWAGKFRERLQFAGGRYAIGSAPIPLPIRVLRELLAEPAGRSASDLAELLGKRKDDILEVIRTLREQGAVARAGAKAPATITDVGRNHLREWENGSGPSGNRSGTPPERHGNQLAPDGSGNAHPRGANTGTIRTDGASRTRRTRQVDGREVVEEKRPTAHGDRWIPVEPAA